MLLNRAPTLHRLGIQAFEPVLVEGKAIQLHPLVCTPYNADFDGDQMAVHLPLSAEAQAEARILMLSANNILSPATGRPITVPTQDMVFGAYYLTLRVEEGTGAGRVFRHLHELEAAFDAGDVELQVPITLRPRGLVTGRAPCRRRRDAPNARRGQRQQRRGRRHRGQRQRHRQRHRVRDDAGPRAFNEALPEGFAFVNDVVGKRNTPIGTIVEELSANYPKHVVAASLDRIKALGFRFAAQSGLTISINDVQTPPDKMAILDRYEKEAEKAETQFKRGIITDDERRQKEIEIWTSANSEVGRAMEAQLATIAFNPLDMMVDSGARGNSQQIRQIAGMKGLVSNPRGEMIPRPIKSSFREGLSVLEYFISTHGARKGLADTALRTADSGYLTRRLVDVAQELIVRIEDCETTRGVWIEGVAPDGPGHRNYLETRAFGRLLTEDVTAERRHHVPRGHPARRRDPRRHARRRSRGAHPHPLGAHVRVAPGRLRRLLRLVARHGLDDRARRGGRRDRRPVHRRAGHAADDADLPHRWCGRRGHHARSAPRGRALRGPHPQGRRGARRTTRARSAWRTRRRVAA